VTDATSPLPSALDDLAAAQAHDHALVELEVAADTAGERIVDRASATFVTWALRAVGARRVVELGAGRGALTWWLAGAVGADGELHAVTRSDDAPPLRDRLRRSGRAGQLAVHTTDADDGTDPVHLDAVGGDLDAVVVAGPDPSVTASWAALVDRVRSGGVIVVGGVLPGGALPSGEVAGLVREALEDPELWTTLVPLGGGWLAALKARSDLAGGATDRLW
jgi:predicted O-methyltransferase YrrM